MWYFQNGSTSDGPHAEERITGLIGDGKIKATTLLWSPNLTEWTPAYQVEAFAAKFSPPPLPLVPPPLPATPKAVPNVEPEADAMAELERHFAEELAKEVRNVPASAWGRYFARMTDINIFALLFGFTAVPLAIYFPAVLVAISEYEALVGIAIVIMAHLFSIFCLSIFGNTLGKKIVGLTVVSQNRREGFSFYWKRELEVLFAGLAMGIPIFALFTLIQQYRRVSRGEPASYDVGRAQVLVRARRERIEVGFALWVASILVVVGLMVLDKVDQQSLTMTKLWTNPLSGRSATIPQTWEQRPIDGKNVVYLTSDYLKAEAVMGKEDASSIRDARAYGAALASALSDQVQVRGEWKPVNIDGREVYEIGAKHTTSAGVDVLISVQLIAGTAWRTLLFAKGRKVDENDKLMQLRSRLWQTVPER